MGANRILDASINRCSEGIRVLEDIARFKFCNRELSATLRNIRHGIREISKDQEMNLLSARDSSTDVGIITSKEAGLDTRVDLKDCVNSNFKRVQESLRTIEEMLKSLDRYEEGKNVEALRFDIYSIEKDFHALFVRKTLPHGIYGILGEKFSRGKTNIQVAKEMVEGGIDILQYREKLTDKSFRSIYNECREIRKITTDFGVPFIINDFAEIALMVDADGIHQGQDDLPISGLRKTAPDMMLGCSTHSPEQARQAVADGADYIGVGPLYTTRTKVDVCDAVGLDYLSHVVMHHSIPFVAIGGVKRHNLSEVIARGAKTVCLVTEIIGADDIQKRIQEIKGILEVKE